MSEYFPGSTPEQDAILRALGHKPPMNDTPPKDRKAQEPEVFYLADILDRPHFYAKAGLAPFVTHAAFLAEQSAHAETKRELLLFAEQKAELMNKLELDRAAHKETKREKEQIAHDWKEKCMEADTMRQHFETVDKLLATERAKREEAEGLVSNLIGFIDGLKRHTSREVRCVIDDLAAILADTLKEGE